MRGGPLLGGKFEICKHGTESLVMARKDEGYGALLVKGQGSLLYPHLLLRGSDTKGLHNLCKDKVDVKDNVTHKFLKKEDLIMVRSNIK